MKNTEYIYLADFYYDETFSHDKAQRLYAEDAYCYGILKNFLTDSSLNYVEVFKFFKNGDLKLEELFERRGFSVFRVIYVNKKDEETGSEYLDENQTVEYPIFAGVMLDLPDWGLY